MTTKYSFTQFLAEIQVMSITPMQYLTIMNKVRVYFEYRKHFDTADTPEGVALARWGLDDAERDYYQYGASIHVKLPRLYYLRHAVY